jgi:hypothetical protein
VDASGNGVPDSGLGDTGEGMRYNDSRDTWIKSLIGLARRQIASKWLALSEVDRRRLS